MSILHFSVGFELLVPVKTSWKLFNVNLSVFAFLKLILQVLEFGGLVK